MGSNASEFWLPCRESLQAGPEDLPKRLRPLLQLRLEEISSVYAKLRGQDCIPVDMVAQELHLEQSVVKSLGTRSFDVLVLLLLASRTHFLTKVHFLFAMSAEHSMNYTRFRQVVAAFLRAVGQLGSGTRRKLPASRALLDSLAFHAFRKYEPAMSLEDFLQLARADYVGGFLRRFSAGRASEACDCSVPVWPVQQREVHEVARPADELPKRKGYFLAIQSERETALEEELEQILLIRQRETLESTVDLELREKAIREELLTYLTDDEARREYRRKVQKFWHRSRPNSARPNSAKSTGHANCRGRLWTASIHHVARGGVLPAGIPRPITPTAVQAAVASVVSSTSASRTITDRVLQHFRDDRQGSKHGEASATSSEFEERCLFRRADVLAAFELYRSDYWLREGAGRRSLLKSGLPIQIPKDMSPADRAWRRKMELELMFQEVAEEKSALHTPAASQELSLRGFLKAVFPLAKRTDLLVMMQWIKKPPNENKVQRTKKMAQPDLGLLRDLIELFDVIDSDKSGFVPIEAVERFLSGEIVTQGEKVRLARPRTGQRSVVNFAYYPSNPRAALILNKTLEDREEWQVATSERASTSKSLEQRMRLLASALDTELHTLAQGDDNLVSEFIEVASNPWRHSEFEPPGESGRIRLVRLYWRYLVGSAIAQQLREDPASLELREGKLDLSGFICVLAQDQVHTIFALSRCVLSPAQIRRFAYAFD